MLDTPIVKLLHGKVELGPSGEKDDDGSSDLEERSCMSAFDHRTVHEREVFTTASDSSTTGSQRRIVLELGTLPAFGRSVSSERTTTAVPRSEARWMHVAQCLGWVRIDEKAMARARM